MVLLSWNVLPKDRTAGFLLWIALFSALSFCSRLLDAPFGRRSSCFGPFIDGERQNDQFSKPTLLLPILLLAPGPTINVYFSFVLSIKLYNQI